jgi:hypothetical protein
MTVLRRQINCEMEQDGRNRILCLLFTTRQESLIVNVINSTQQPSGFPETESPRGIATRVS